MSRYYFYLISSLPEYSFDADYTKIDVKALYEEIKSNLSPKDRKDAELLSAYYDIVNVLIYINGGKIPFNHLGNLTPEQIKAEVDGVTGQDEDGENPSLLPNEIRHTIDVYKGRNLSEDEDPDTEVTSDDIERRLFTDFYKLCSRSKNKFLRRWGDIDRTLRNIATAYRARKMGLDPSGMIIGDGELERQIIENSNAAYFGIKDEFAYTENFFQVMEVNDFVQREHKMDALRWEIVEEETRYENFTISEVLAYLIKLNIFNRWITLDKAEGVKRFRKIVGDLAGIDTQKD